MPPPIHFTVPITSHRRRPHRPLSLESLEPRHLLSFTARQVLDLNTTEVGASPGDFSVIGDDLFFRAPGDIYQSTRQLWKYDGATVTQLTHLSVMGVTTPPTALQDKVYFAGEIGDENPELWSYSRERGATIAADLNPNDDNYEDGSHPADLILFDNRLVFSAATKEHGRELWSFDGSTARQVANINEVPLTGYDADAGSQPTELTIHAGQLYFVADDGIHGPTIWRFDGQSTTLAIDVDPADALVGLTLISLTTFEGDLYFVKNSHAAPGELWRYNGDSAARVGAFPYPVWTEANSAAYQGHLYFTIPSTVHDWRRSNHEIWRTDGSQLERMPDFPTVVALDLAVYEDELYFIADDNRTGSELWKYDGSRAARATNINVSGDSVYNGFAVYRDELYFAATDTGFENVEIWKFNGAVAHRAADVRPGNAGAGPGAMTTLDGSLYFFANAGNGQSGLFKLEGPAATLVSPPGINASGGWGPFYAHSGSTAYFLAQSSSSTVGLWQLADGRATHISDTCGGKCSIVYYDGIVALGDEIFFAALDHDQKRSIWRFDGKQFESFPDLPVIDVSNSIVIRNQLYLANTASLSSQFVVLRYDGTDFEDVTNFFGSQPFLGSALEFDGRVYYPAYDTAIGAELWSSDLTPGGAQLVIEPVPGPSSSQPYNLTVLGNALYFTAIGGPNRGLWRLEKGQATQITDTNLSVEFSGFDPLVVFDNQLIFPAATSQTRGLWSYDGQHTSPIADFSNARYTYFVGMTAVGDTLYFAADDFFHGTELWKLTIDRDADLDADGAIGMSDAVILQRNLGLQSGATRAQGDLDGDTAVTPLDAAILAKQFARRPSIASASPAISSAVETTRLQSSRRLTAARANVRPEPAAVDAALTTIIRSTRPTSPRRS